METSEDSSYHNLGSWAFFSRASCSISSPHSATMRANCSASTGHTQKPLSDMRNNAKTLVFVFVSVVQNTIFVYTNRSILHEFCFSQVSYLPTIVLYSAYRARTHARILWIARTSDPFFIGNNLFFMNVNTRRYVEMKKLNENNRHIVPSCSEARRPVNGLTGGGTCMLGGPIGT